MQAPHYSCSPQKTGVNMSGQIIKILTALQHFIIINYIVSIFCDFFQIFSSLCRSKFKTRNWFRFSLGRAFLQFKKDILRKILSSSLPYTCSIQFFFFHTSLSPVQSVQYPHNPPKLLSKVISKVSVLTLPEAPQHLKELSPLLPDGCPYVTCRIHQCSVKNSDAETVQNQPNYGEMPVQELRQTLHRSSTPCSLHCQISGCLQNL